MGDIGNEWANPKKKTLGTRGLINKGQALVIINGKHGLMGGRSLWELSKIMIFYKEFNLKSIIWGIVVFFQSFNDQQ